MPGLYPVGYIGDDPKVLLNYCRADKRALEEQNKKLEDRIRELERQLVAARQNTNKEHNNE